MIIGLLILLIGGLSTNHRLNAQTGDDTFVYLPLVSKDSSEIDLPTGGTATPAPPASSPTPTAPANRDSDGDGLTDTQEVELGTNPSVADTDGDGFDDKEEVDNWDPNSGNHLRFNPLVADVPSLRADQFSLPVVEMFYKKENSSRVSKGMTDSSESEVTTVTEKGRENVHKVEEQHAVNVNSNVKKRGPIKSGSLEVEYGYEHTDTNTNKNYWNETTKNKNKQASSDFYKETTGQVIEEQGGKIQVTMGLLNDSDISYTLSNMDVTAYMINPRNPGNLIPVGTLRHDGPLSFTLDPQGAVENPDPSLYRTLVFTFDTDNPDEIAKVLESSNQLILRPDNFMITGQDPDLDLNLAAQNIQARTAEVIIDFGGQQGLKTETYRVAVDTGHGDVLGFEDLFTHHLDIDYAFSAEAFPGVTAPNSGLTSIRTVEMSSASRSYWLAAHTFRPAGSPPGTTQTELYNILDTSYTASDINLRKGDTLHLVYVTDTDLDGLSDRLEILGNSDLNNPDTDGDGLDDAQETYGWYTNLTSSPCDVGTQILVKSDPLEQDTDGDGKDDSVEFEECTNPQGDLTVEISGPAVVGIGEPFALRADPANFSNSNQLTYEWAQIGGPSIGPLPNTASIDVPAQASVTGLRFEVTVTDAGQNDATATTADTTIVVKDTDQMVFVDQDSGDDSQNSGRSPNSPLKSITRALNPEFSGSDLYIMTPVDGGFFNLNQTINLT